MSLQGLQVGDYRLQYLVESDGVVETYLALRLPTKQQAIIKIIRTDLASCDARLNIATQRLLSKAEALGKLNHPNILPLSGFGWAHVNNLALPCITIPQSQEKNLDQWLQERGVSRLTPGEVAFIIHQVAGALEYAHKQGFIHGRLAPENILIWDHPQQLQQTHLLLENFDLSVSPGTISISQQLPGMYAYIAPEQWNGEQTQASDQYSLAVLAYKLLTGRTPFEGKANDTMQQHLTVEPSPPSTFDPQISQDTDFVLLHALAKMPQKRFASLSAFDRAFQSSVHEAQAVSKAPEAAPRQQGQSPIQKEPGEHATFVDELTLARQKADQTQQVNQPIEGTQITFHKESQAPLARVSPITVLLIALALCSIIGSFFIYYVAIYRPGQLYAQSTATALAPTLTAQVTTNAQAQASATSTYYQDSYDQLTATTPTVVYPMTNPNDKTWDKVNGTHGSCSSTNTGYLITVNEKSGVSNCFARTTDFSNFAYQAQMQMSKGDYCIFLFRVNLVKQVGYIFDLFSNGVYRLLAITGPNSQDRVLLNGITIPIAVGQAYQVTIVARGNNFDVYINGSYVNSARDIKATSNSGVIGLGAGTFNSNTADVVYTEVQVWNL
jgi:serine/threonine protein kinase